MDRSNLTPFTRENLDILFVGLNPAKGSSDNKHYFSVNQSFWNQLYKSGLICDYIDKRMADEYVFGSNAINYRHWHYGITDLITNIADSNSNNIKVDEKDCEALINSIKHLKPKVVILLHSKVVKNICKYLKKDVQNSNYGFIFNLDMDDAKIRFYSVAFPHGNSIKSEDKVKRYKEIKIYLEDVKRSGITIS